LYVPSGDSGAGYVLFIRDGSLLAQRFDERKLELSADPVPIAPSVSEFGASANGVIAYLTGGAPKTSLTWYDRKGKILGAAGQPAAYASMSLSPDGKQVAAQRLDGDSIDLWLIGSESGSSGGAATRFTFDKPNDMCPVWSPDGSQIVFASARDGPMGIYRKHSTGAGSDELLVKSKSQACPMDFSPDGRLLLYEDVGEKASYGNLWVLPLDGNRRPFVFHKTEFGETAAAFSPDGKWIVYQSNGRQPPGEQYEGYYNESDERADNEAEEQRKLAFIAAQPIHPSFDPRFPGNHYLNDHHRGPFSVCLFCTA
jgi:Tol biopolymer transport system component